MKRLLALPFLFIVSVLVAEEPRTSRVDLTSVPEGAVVCVDGIDRGVTPLTLWDIRPGEHHLVFSLDGYEDASVEATVAEGSYVQRSATLQPKKGLLLVTSEPSNCELFVDDVPFGTTPRLVTELEVTKSHQLILRKSGYLPQRQTVKFDGRRPAVRQIAMTLDSGNVICASSPEGARVAVNGVDAGITPLTLERMPKGISTFEFTLNGYRSVKKTVEILPGDERRVSVELEPLPGEIRITSHPRGIKVYLDGQLKDNAPTTLKDVTVGEHRIKGVLSGYIDFEKTVEVRPGDSFEVDLRLDSDVGSLEVKSNPSGAQILLDGRQIGVTRALGGQETSETLRFDSIPSGEHEVTFRLTGYGDVVRKVKVERGESSSLSARLKRKFVPDVEVRTVSGTYPGVLLSNTSEGVTIETSPGVSRSFRHSDIRELNFLSDTLK